ncbi:MAG: DUF1638 domain-containing protein [Methanomassiliicoccales archaeon]|jgi:hypothetical protein
MEYKIAILACDALRKEIDTITSNEKGIISKEYLEFGLHLNPTDLKKEIIRKLKMLEGKVDVVFLGYGVCQALKDVPKSVDVPVVMIDAEDCIAALLTTEKYHEEKTGKGITWFYPAGWADYGRDGLIQLFNLNTVKDDRYTPEYFFKLLFDGFNRCLFIDTGMEGADICQKNSEQLACTLDLKHECTHGTLELIEDAWARTKAVAQIEAESLLRQLVKSTDDSNSNLMVQTIDVDR